MEVGIEKTVVFLLFIFLGVLLKIKFKSPEEVNGIKKIILNLALPATIFIALLGIEVKANLLFLPLLALLLNALLFLIMPYLFPLTGIKKNTPTYRTARLLVPSLAPGLSCFPFVLEFLGEPYLAKAAMADLGNKIFVLIFLYLIAMRWYYARQQGSFKAGKKNLLSLLKTLVTEPVNLFIAAALLLLLLGLNMQALPFVIGETLSKLSLMMTPLVLLFIGLAVKIKRKQFLEIFTLLSMRAGLVFLLSGIFVSISGLKIQNDVLLILAFGLSACSFWPYAHICLVDHLEVDKTEKTFNNGYAISILALSFPLSTILILGVLNSGTFFVRPTPIFLMGLTLVALGVLPSLLRFCRQKVIRHKGLGPKWVLPQIRFKKLIATETLLPPTKDGPQ
ncbi:MAG: permease [Bacteroidota bacterium]